MQQINQFIRIYLKELEMTYLSSLTNNLFP